MHKCAHDRAGFSILVAAHLSIGWHIAAQSGAWAGGTHFVQQLNILQEVASSLHVRNRLA